MSTVTYRSKSEAVREIARAYNAMVVRAADVNVEVCAICDLLPVDCSGHVNAPRHLVYLPGGALITKSVPRKSEIAKSAFRAHSARKGKAS